MLAYLDPGSGAAIATVIASGAVGASAIVGRWRRQVSDRLGGRSGDEPGLPNDAASVPGADATEGR